MRKLIHKAIRLDSKCLAFAALWLFTASMRSETLHGVVVSVSTNGTIVREMIPQYETRTFRQSVNSIQRIGGAVLGGGGPTTTRVKVGEVRGDLLFVRNAPPNYIADERISWSVIATQFQTNGIWVVDYEPPRDYAAEAAQAKAAALAARMAQATNGVGGAQYTLGLGYASGIGVERNPELARYWLEKAATNGFPKATNMLNKLSPPRHQPQ